MKSWLFVGSLVVGLFAAGLSLGYAYAAGSLPAIAYALADPSASPLEERLHREREDAFAANYDLIVDWQKLRAIAASILKDNPDGLTGEFETAASLLAQIRGTRGEARFLSGTIEHILRLRPEGDTVKLDWDEQDSLVPRIARDAGYELTPDQLRVANSNLNWAQFTYLDDAMQHVLIHRGIDGTLSLTLRE